MVSRDYVAHSLLEVNFSTKFSLRSSRIRVDLVSYVRETGGLRKICTVMQNEDSQQIFNTSLKKSKSLCL